MNQRILWLVAARSGSKSIPDKNIQTLDGIPLLAYRIKSALTLSRSEDIWISTDSRKYAEIAESFGATVPFIRPAELATDSAKSADVVMHAMQHAERLKRSYDAVALLEPTAPFVPSSDLKAASEKLFEDHQAEAIVAVRIVKPSTFYIQNKAPYLDQIAHNIKNEGVLRRQDEKEEITPCGGFYLAKWGFFLEKRTFYSPKTIPYLLSNINGLEIDEPLELKWANFLVEKKIIDIDTLFK